MKWEEIKTILRARMKLKRSRKKHEEGKGKDV